jgi:hypothetical protein
LIRLSDCVENNRLYHIDKRRYHSARHYEIGKLIDKVHDLIGYKKESTIDELNRNLKEMVNPYKNYHIGWQEPFKNNPNLSVSRHLQKKAHLFRISQPKILSSLSNAIENIDELHNIDQLFTQPKNQEIMTHKYAPIKPISAEEAFDYEIDYTHSVYANHNFKTAILEGKEFFVAYTRYARISELMKGKWWCNSKGFEEMRFEIENQARKLYEEHYESTLADSMSA